MIPAHLPNRPRTVTTTQKDATKLPLFVVDDKVMSMAELTQSYQKLDVQVLSTFAVDAAVQRFGKQVANGAIAILTKTVSMSIK